MTAIDILLGGCLACVAYTFVGYPVVAAVRAKLRGRPIRRGEFIGSFSIVVAVHNEKANIVRRLAELTRLIGSRNGDIVVVFDGCTDGSLSEAETFVDAQASDRFTLVVLPENRGKAVALNEGVAKARGDIVLFADARQTWADDAIDRLLSNFADPDVGAVSGDLKLETAPGVLAGVGLYWRFEKWLRIAESRAWSQVGVTGAVSGVRRELFRPIPAGTLLDDVYWPMIVAMAGYRVVHDDSAHAFDRLPPKSSAEFRRKVRTLAGNYQLVGLLPRSLLPWRNPVWLAWVSHKLMRLLVPWALLGLLATSALVGRPETWALFAAQVAFYAIAALGMIPGLGRNRWLSASSSFVVLNVAAWVAFWVWLTGRTGSAWRKVDYAPPPSSSSE